MAALAEQVLHLNFVCGGPPHAGLSARQQECATAPSTGVAEEGKRLPLLAPARLYCLVLKYEAQRDGYRTNVPLLLQLTQPYCEAAKSAAAC